MIEIKHVNVVRAAVVIAAAYVTILLALFVGWSAVSVLAALFKGDSLIFPVRPIYWAGASIVLAQGVVVFLAFSLLCSIYNGFASKFGGIVVEVRDLGPRVAEE